MKPQIDQQIVIHQTAHWGEVIQIPVLTEDRSNGRISYRPQVQLVTLPCKDIMSRVEFQPEPGDEISFVNPECYRKAARAAKLALQLLDRRIGGVFSIRHLGIDIESGMGTGRSSADVIGTLRVVAMVCGLDASRVPDFIGQIAQRIEGGVDPLMFDHPVLYASREGRVLRRYPKMPPMWVVAFAFQQPVDTSELARRQAEQGFPEENLALGPMVVRMFEAALIRRDPELLADAATLSAQLNQKLVAFPHFEELRRCAMKARTGLSISHSGSVGALLLSGARSSQAAEGLAASLHRHFSCPTYVWKYE